jgi:hypothetical protein
MTTGDLFLRLYEAGCSRDEILSSDLSHLLIRLRADVRRPEREERAAFRATHNAIATSLFDDAENPYAKAHSTANRSGSGGDLDGMKYRVQTRTDLDIERDLTT